MSNLTSAEWAAWWQTGAGWLQAIGSIVAIIAAAKIATHQANLQHRNAEALHRLEKRTDRVDLAKTISVLATNASKAMRYVSGQLDSREAIHRVAEGLAPCDVGEVGRIDGYVREIPIHTIPYSLVTPTMTLGATVRQYREKVELVLRVQREMDAAMFDDFFKTMREMNESMAATCRDVETEVKRLETTA